MTCLIGVLPYWACAVVAANKTARRDKILSSDFITTLLFCRGWQVDWCTSQPFASRNVSRWRRKFTNLKQIALLTISQLIRLAVIRKFLERAASASSDRRNRHHLRI